MGNGYLAFARELALDAGKIIRQGFLGTGHEPHQVNNQMLGEGYVVVGADSFSLSTRSGRPVAGSRRFRALAINRGCQDWVRRAARTAIA
jgi:hypothetical protein